MDIDPNSNSDSDSESVKSVDSGELDQGLQITDYKKKKSRRKKKSENISRQKVSVMSGQDCTVEAYFRLPN